MTGTIVVRRATAADSAVLTRIMQDSRAYDGAYHAIIDAYPVTAAMIARDEIFVAEMEGRICGFYSLVTEKPELDLMFVDNDAQGTGAGRVLFEHMRARARALGMDVVRIVSHPPSEGFYLRMGAVRTGTRAPNGRITWEQPVLTLQV